MPSFPSLFYVLTCSLLALGGFTTAEDSLQGALEFVNQRQQDLANDYRNKYLNALDLELLEHRKNDLERTLLKYLQRQQDDDERIQTSPFRERTGKPRSHEYRNKFPNEDELQNAYKRAQSIYDSYYGNLGWNSVGLRKRQPSRDYVDIPISKRNSNMPATDPRVEQELQKVFNPPKSLSDDKKPSATKKPIGKTVKTSTTAPDANLTAETMSLNKEKPLEMEKKSIKWSDYFGIDRRKKSEAMDNEWLINRYHKANAITKKSNMIGGAPLRAVAAGRNKKDEEDTSRIARLDEELKDIEETIIDEALKFTGAHDDVDSREMQEVKDSIISRLATAYNVEKMRQALKQYRDSLPDIPKDEKRVAVARKEAIDEDRSQNEHEDNRIKCTDVDEHCNEQNYNIPEELIEGVALESGHCRWIDRACEEVLQHWGAHGSTLGRACHMHQMCMLCSNNSWFAPTRKCNVLFLSKANRLCADDNNCQRAAREAVKYLQHISRNIDMELISDCHLDCGDKR